MLCVGWVMVAFGFFVAKILTRNHTQRSDKAQGEPLVSLIIGWVLGGLCE
jgi:hypothetical protein